MIAPFASGAFSELFDLGAGVALKAFFDVEVATRPNSDPRLIPAVAFAAEERAYRRLRDHPELELWVPMFFGSTDARTYPLDSDRDFSSGCGLLFERIPGDAAKLYELPSTILKSAEAVLEEMKTKIGIRDPWDGSAFVPGSRAPATLIDFATPTDEFVALDDILSQADFPSTQQLHRLGIQDVVAGWG